MKFNCLIKLTILTLIISGFEFKFLNEKRLLRLNQIKKLKNINPLTFRFQDNQKMNEKIEPNLFIMNSEILASKP